MWACECGRVSVSVRVSDAGVGESVGEKVGESVGESVNIHKQGVWMDSGVTPVRCVRKHGILGGSILGDGRGAADRVTKAAALSSLSVAICFVSVSSSI